jgi:hypothetical protein
VVRALDDAEALRAAGPRWLGGELFDPQAVRAREGAMAKRLAVARTLSDGAYHLAWVERGADEQAPNAAFARWLGSTRTKTSANRPNPYPPRDISLPPSGLDALLRDGRLVLVQPGVQCEDLRIASVYRCRRAVGGWSLCLTDVAR